MQTDNSGRALDDDTLDTMTIGYSNSMRVNDENREAKFNGFLAQPKDGAKRGSVIVVHEIFGLTDHIKDVACRYARQGYTALAINLFTREGEPPPISGGFDALREFVGKITDAQVMGDLDGAMEFLRDAEESNGKVGIVGYCWGGRVAMLYDAHAPTLDAAIAYYGRIVGEPTPAQPHSPLGLAPQMYAPLQGHFGAEDTSITPAHAAQLRDALQAAHKTAEIYVYDNAGHAFNNETRESYRPEAAKIAFERSLEWFGMYLKSATG